MPTPDELRAAIAEGRETLRQAIVGAGPRWDREATEGRSVRKAAEHAIAADVFFASQVCAACGYPGLDAWPADYESPSAALEGLEAAAAKADGRLKYVTETDLPMKHEQMGTVVDIMTLNANHLKEHAAQIAGA